MKNITKTTNLVEHYSVDRDSILRILGIPRAASDQVAIEVDGSFTIMIHVTRGATVTDYHPPPSTDYQPRASYYIRPPGVRP